MRHWSVDQYQKEEAPGNSEPEALFITLNLASAGFFFLF
jgi:hypothetical protein